MIPVWLICASSVYFGFRQNRNLLCCRAPRSRQFFFDSVLRTPRILKTDRGVKYEITLADGLPDA